MINKIEKLNCINSDDGKLTLSHAGEWDFRNAKHNLKNPDFIAYAIWFIADLKDSEIETLRPILQVWNTRGGWLQYEVANSIGMLLNNEARKKRAVKAIDKNDCKAFKYPSFQNKNDRDAVGAVVCELHNSGLESKLSSLMTDPEIALKRMMSK